MQHALATLSIKYGAASIGNKMEKKLAYENVSAMSDLKVKTVLEITVMVNERPFKPVVHRYLDLLICSLRSALRKIDFGSVCNSTPQIFIQNYPLTLGQHLQLQARHHVQIAGDEAVIGLGELSSAWRDSGSQKVLLQDPVIAGPYTTNQNETYFTPPPSEYKVYIGISVKYIANFLCSWTDWLVVVSG